MYSVRIHTALPRIVSKALSLLAVEWSWVLVLRWRSLGELSPFNIMWGREVSGGPMS